MAEAAEEFGEVQVALTAALAAQHTDERDA